MDNSERQAILDAEHLRLLRIGYFISAATTACMAFAGVLYLFLGLLMTIGFSGFPDEPGAPDARFMGWLFAAIGGAIFMGAIALAVLKVLTAVALGRRRMRTLCLIAAGVTTLGIPYGTALGVLTIIVLVRPSVERLFEASRPGTPPQAPAFAQRPPG